MDESLNVMERSVIGSILEPSTRTLEDIDLDPADFRDPKCEAVYRVATEMHMQGKHVDTTTVDAAIRADPEFVIQGCLLYTSPSPRDLSTSRMPSSA